MRRAFAYFMVFHAALALATAANAQTLFTPGTPEVDQLVALYHDAGRVFPVSSYPVSKAELSRFAERLAAIAPPDTDAALRAYRSQVLRFDPSHDRISASGSANFEFYFRTQNVPFDPGIAASEQSIDLQRLFLEREPLGAFQLDYARDGQLELGVSAVIQREYFMDPFNSTNLWESNAAGGNPLALENQDIMRGIAWYDFKPLQVELGRDKVQLGPEGDSLLPSLKLPFLDVLRLRLPLGPLTGDLVLSTLDTRAAPTQAVSAVTLLAIHRYEYAFESVRIGLAGLAVYSRPANAFTLADIFPVMSWHNAGFLPNNFSIVADASWVPIPRLSISGQIGFDDINLSSSGLADSGVPTIPAAIVAAAYSVPVGGSLGVALHAEAGYTHYLWGNFEDEQGSTSARAAYNYVLDGGSAVLPLTSPYGPGATWVELSGRLSGIPWLDATVTARYLSRMTDGSGSPVSLSIPYASSSAIEHAPRIDTWSVGCKVGALPFGFIRISVEPTLYVQQNHVSRTQTVWAEVALSAGVFGETVSYIEQ
jgi:hypothetical protein